MDGWPLPRVADYDYARLIREHGGETYENREPVEHVRVVPFTTYGASASEECLIESNYDAALDIFRAYGIDYAHSDDLYSYRGYLVAELYREDSDGIRDVSHGFTPAAIVTFDILSRLADYPCLDESDYCEREYNAWEEYVNDECRYARHDDDSDEQHDDITRRVICDGVWDSYGFSPDCTPDIGALYTEARNAYFNARAREHYLAEIPGQEIFNL